jgi:type II restriction enzyme
MLKPFDEFLSQLSETNATLDYFVDFDKILILNRLSNLFVSDIKSEYKTEINFNNNSKAKF